MKVLYAPFSIVAGIIGARAGHKAFNATWERISDSPRPRPTEPDASLAKVTFAAALEGATLAACGAAAHTVAARAFHHVFGSWPGKAPKTAADTAA